MMNENILIVGTDQALLRSRALILERCRPECHTALPEDALARIRTDHCSVLVVCSSLPFEEATTLIDDVRSEFAEIAIIRLVAPGSPTVFRPIANAVVNIDFHPQTWLGAVEKLLAERDARNHA